MRRSIPTIVLAVVSAALAAGDDAKPGTPYRVHVASTLTVKTKQGETKAHTEGAFDYRLIRKGNEVQSAIDGGSILFVMNGAERARATFNSQGMTAKNQKGTTKVEASQRPEIFASFGKPIATYVLDNEGAEISRKVAETPSPLFTPDQFENTRIFHPRFARKLDEWDAPALFPSASGQMARGTVHYKKTGEKGGVVTVAVSGKLAATYKSAQAILKSGTYEVKGVQSFDINTNEWISGKLDVQMKFEGEAPNGEIVSASGPVTMTLVSGAEAAKPETP